MPLRLFRRVASPVRGSGQGGSHRKTRRLRWPGRLQPAGPRAPLYSDPVASAAGPTASAAGRSAGRAVGPAIDPTGFARNGTGLPFSGRPAGGLPQAGPGEAVRPFARPESAAAGIARAAIRTKHQAANASAGTALTTVARQAELAAANAKPWYQAPATAQAAEGMRDCGCLEEILHRDWAPHARLAPATVAAIDRLAELPRLIKEKLVAGLEAIYVGSGGVPDLDHMGDLKGVPLPSGRATWDACAGAYGDRKIIVGSRPSPTPDVMCHEIGHALDDIDGSGEQWQSDTAEFFQLYRRCRPQLAGEFHRQDGSLGRREFFADAFAAIASSQRPALVEMLSGDTRAALDVMLYFNTRYGI